MKKKMQAAFLLMSAICLFNASSIYTQATPHYEMNTLYTIECTAYCDSENLTSTGCEVRKGVCAFAPEYYGKVAVVYYDNELVGIYEILDTGSCEAGVRTGEVLDLWFETQEECIEFGRKQCVVYFVDGKG